MQKSKLIIAILILLNSISITSFAQDKIIDQIVAIIGSNIILKSDIEAAAHQSQLNGITTDGDMKCEILEQLMVEKLLVAEAELDTNITVTDNEINQQLDAQIEFYKQRLVTEKAVEEYFNKPIVKIKAELQDNIRNNILSSQMRSKLIENIKATPSEVRYYYRNLPDDEKKKVNTQYEYAQIMAIPIVSEAEETRIKDLLRSLKKRVDNGEDFFGLAVLYSEGPSALQGGNLGYFGKAEMDAAFSAAAFNLKPGQVSNVVKSEMGYHIIQMIDRRGDKINCRHIILKPKVPIEEKAKIAERMDSLVNEIRREKLSFSDAAMRYSDDKSSRNNGGIVVNPNTMSSRFDASELPPDVSKVLDKLNINEISKSFITIDERSHQEVVVVVKLINKIEAHTANLTDDYPLLSEMYLQKKQEEAILEFVKERQSKTYIRIDDTYANCNFKFKNWIK